MTTGSFSLTNGAGYVTGPGKEFDSLLTSAVDAITIGTVTMQPRAGNEGTTEAYVRGASISRRGLPGPGLSKTLCAARQMRKMATDAGKTLRYSVAGTTNQEFATLARALCRFGEIEINLNAPEAWDMAVGSKDPIAYNGQRVRKILELLDAALPEKSRYAVKIPPIGSRTQLDDLVASVIRSGGARAIITCDGFTNAILADRGRPALPGGFGSLGGKPLAPIALGMAAACSQTIARFAARGMAAIQVIGVGGITEPDDARAMLSVGASGIQIYTGLVEQGPGIFAKIRAALEADDAEAERSIAA